MNQLETQASKMSTKPGYKKTKLGWIPEDWDIKKLSEIALFRNGKGHEGIVAENGDFILVNSKFVSSEGRVVKRVTKNLEPLIVGEIAIVMSDVPNGKAIAKCFLIDESNVYALNQRIGGITATGILNTFLFLQLNRNKYYLKLDDGVKQTNLRKIEVLNCPIKLPPLPEQRCIAAILSTWDKAIDTLQNLIAKKQERKKGLMQVLLTGQLRFGGIKEKWGKYQVEELFEFLSSTPVTRKQLEYSAGDKKVKNIHYGDIHAEYDRILLSVDGNRVVPVLKEGVKFSNNVVYLIDGDLVIADASEDYKGVADCIELENVGKNLVIAGLHTIALRDEKKITMPGIRGYLFKSENVVKQLRKIAIGSKVYGVSKGNLKKIELLIPSTVEQQKIASVLSAADREIENLQSQLEKLQEQKKGLIQKLLTGEVRVVGFENLSHLSGRDIETSDTTNRINK